MILFYVIIGLFYTIIISRTKLACSMESTTAYVPIDMNTYLQEQCFGRKVVNERSLCVLEKYSTKKDKKSGGEKKKGSVKISEMAAINS